MKSWFYTFDLGRILFVPIQEQRAGVLRKGRVPTKKRVTVGLLCVLASFCSVAAGANTPDAGAFWAGTAKVDITPGEETILNEYSQPLAIRDHVEARVLVLKDGKSSVAIVSVDMLVFASAKVVEEAKRKWGVSQVVLSATHTHSSFSPRGLMIRPPKLPDWTRTGRAPAETVDWPGLSSDPWYAATEEKIIEAIGQAMKSLFPARVVSGKGPFESAYMAHNRRLVGADGRVTPLWENPERRPTSPVDPTVGVLRVEDLSGKPRAFAVLYACHPVALMSAEVLSRDFPGAMVDYVEQELGPDCMGMFLQGAQGDLDPYDLHNLRGENRFNIVKQAGISLGKGALRVAASIPRPPAGSVPSLAFRESLLEVQNRSQPRTTETGMLTVVINQNLALVTIPGEPFIQHQLDLSARSPIPNTFILGVAYHGKGTPFLVYVPTVKAVKEGGYGATECSFVAPDTGEKMVNEAVARIREIKDEKLPQR